ncbi:MAG: flavodoxin-dependent (E)-4-hydroxy-3-methylbut-2-enyl-diphosphate synthase [Clostridia bacterium]|nr:flavodoxin-dependent (E)-4-hydroxy-3-methylbut-2-enyl-diphosphate synthase [Clostridia bacterium]
MTRQVFIDTVPMGGGAPVTIQSMTNTDTRDAAATVAQIHRLEAAGCEIVRSAVFDQNAAKALRDIVDKIHIPLVADVHFDYRLAIAAVENGCKKLRINPGNIGSADRVKAVVDCCKMHHIPIRIGVNGGSLNKENRANHPDDPVEAMVESALDHVKLLETQGFYDTVLSVKHSCVRYTVAAMRRLHELTDYPLHVGVTETGSGEAGLIKSAAGIGSLLMDGIGDTVRVSLTGDPVQEVLAAKKILAAVGVRKNDVEIISCPTCGRTRVDLLSIADYVNAHVRHDAGYLKIAVMGCAVNGPGEASDADIGIAFGQGNGVLFRRGEKEAAGPTQEILDRLVREANEMLAGQ